MIDNGKVRNQSDLARKLGILSNSNCVITGSNQQTSREVVSQKRVKTES
jgi:hypothetical protein